MSMETTLEFRGIVKPEFRKEISKIVKYEQYEDPEERYYISTFAEKWYVTYPQFMQRFAYVPNAASLPRESTWNETTGEWSFQVDSKRNTIEEFLLMVPMFMQSLLVCKTQRDCDDYWELYDLNNVALIYLGTRFN